ncbi:MAG: DUF1802 family protein [Cyanobacteria bacterium P01_D01_bin.14]
MLLNHALKEWSVAVEALMAGDTSLLLRKGGIRERAGKFTVPYEQVLLYPTYEHQRPELLKPDYQASVTPVPSGWHPETVTISGWAKIEQVVQVLDADRVRALLPLHIWNEQFVTDRLRWKPQQPLYVLLLRVYALLTPQIIDWRPDYGGCRSWIEVPPVEIADASPVVTDDAQTERIHTLETALQR